MDNLLKINAILNGRYRIDGLIGSGGMGHVYEATHLLIDRKVAIKTLRKNKRIDARAIRRLHQEARIAGSIGNDNICEVTDMGVVDGDIPYLVMPLLSGGSLKQLLRATPVLALERAVDIVSQTLLALEAAHDMQVVHRDLKPDNIFITKVGDRDDFVKLLDFGISKVLSDNGTRDLTEPGTPAGTPYCMAPEQATGGAKTHSHVVGPPRRKISTER